MTPDTANLLLQGIRDIAELVVASGAVTGVFAYLKKHGVDVAAIQNNNLVQAAERGAEAAVLDVTVRGKSLTDPAVLSDVTLALKASLQASHEDTAAAIGANEADIKRIAGNAIGKVVNQQLATTASGDSGGAAKDIATASEVLVGAQTALLAAKSVLAPPPANDPVRAPQPAPAAS